MSGKGLRDPNDEVAKELRWQDVPGVSFEFDPAYLSLPYTFTCGQAFRWHSAEDGAWLGVVNEQVWRLDSSGNVFTFQAYPPPADLNAVQSYLRLDVDLAAIYADLKPRDIYVEAAIAQSPGLRLLAQDPTECLLSFICSTGNAIPRIARSIEKMSAIYGRWLGRLDGQDYYAFPTVASLIAADTAVLARDCDLDYRGQRLQGVASALASRPEDWLEGLKTKPYESARQDLLQIYGVGQKIADCVCLFSLGKDQAVPVDTHIWQVGRDLFWPEMKVKSLTPARYQEIADLFRTRYGRFAGWAQEYLFYSDLMGKFERRRK